MKKHNSKLFAVLVVTGVLGIFALGIGAAVIGVLLKEDQVSEAAVSGTDSVEGGGTAEEKEEIDEEIKQAYKNDYIQQHLDFCSSQEYEEIKKEAGGFAAQTTRRFEEDGTNAANKTWDQMSSFFVLLGSGELDEGAKNTLKITNKYEFIVASLMQTTASKENFSDNSHRLYFDAFIDLMNQIEGFLKMIGDAEKNISEESLGKTEDVINTIQQVTLMLQKFQGKSEPELLDCYQDGMDQVKKKLYGGISKKEQEKLKENLIGLNNVFEMVDVVEKTLTDVMDSYILYEASTNAVDEWCSTWKRMADLTADAKGEESKLFAEAVYKQLDEIEKSKDDMAEALILKAFESTGGTVLNKGLQMLNSIWGDMMEKPEIGRAIRKASMLGVTVTDYITNCDGLAYYSGMLTSTGFMASYCWKAMMEAENTLMAKKDYSSAIAFDQVFNIYKQIQIAACDYGIKYYQELGTAPVGKIIPFSSESEIARTYEILAVKAGWKGLSCHEENNQVINNGGNFVSYQGNTYYWRFAPGSIEQTGILGGFDQIEGVQNELICRTPEGKEIVLLKDTGTGPLFICDNSIFYEKMGNSWGSCLLNGNVLGMYEDVQILDASPEHETVIASDSEIGIYSVLEDRPKDKLVPPEAIYIGMNEAYVYYGVPDKNIMDIYKVIPAIYEPVKIGSIRLPEEEFGEISIGDAVSSRNGIYFTCGYYGGSTMAFWGGGVYQIDLGGRVGIVVDPEEGQEVTFPKIYVKEEKEKSYVYYYCGDSYENAGFWDSWVDESVQCINLSTYETTQESFVLSDIGDVVCRDGKLMTLPDHSGEYREIMSKEQAEQMGYKNMGETSESEEVFVSDLDIVEDEVYFTITKMSEDPSSHVGWRMGYTRESMKTFRTIPGTGEFELINEY